MLRKSCSICPFTNLKRPSDITIGDFWGIERIAPELEKENKGVSLVLINNEKGKQIFESIKPKIKYICCNTENCLQPNLQYPTIMNTKNTAFEEEYLKYGFEYVAKKYGNLGLKYALLDLLREIKNNNKILSFIWMLIRKSLK